MRLPDDSDAELAKRERVALARELLDRRPRRLSARQLRRLLVAVLVSQDDNQRWALALTRFRGMSMKAAGKVLNVSAGKVRELADAAAERGREARQRSARERRLAELMRPIRGKQTTPPTGVHGRRKV